MVDMNAPPWRRKTWPHPVALGCGRGSSCVLSQGVPELPLVQRLWGRPSCRAATPRPLSLCSEADVVLTSLLPPRRRLPPRRAHDWRRLQAGMRLAPARLVLLPPSARVASGGSAPHGLAGQPSETHATAPSPRAPARACTCPLLGGGRPAPRDGLRVRACACAWMPGPAVWPCRLSFPQDGAAAKLFALP